LGLRLGCKEFADGVKRLEVGDRIGTRRPPDGRLVDQNDVVEPVGSLEFAEKVGRIAAFTLPQGMHDRGIEHVVHQGRFAGTGNTGDANQHAERDFYIETGEIVNARAPQNELFPLYLSPPAGNGDGELPAQITAGKGIRVFLDFFDGACGQDPAAQLTRAWTEIDQPVGGANDVGVMFDYQNSIAQVT